MGYNKIPLALGFNDSTGNASGLVEFQLNLSDVGDFCRTDNAPTVGDVLTYDSGNNCWKASAAPAVAAGALSALTDICADVTGVTQYQALVWNGTEWCPSTIPTGGGGGGITSISDAGDVTITEPVADGELLAYDNATSDWINQTTTELGVMQLDPYFDVNDEGAVAQWDGTKLEVSFPDQLYMLVQAGENIVKGDVVYVTGDAGNGRFIVAKADASDPNKMPAVGLAPAAIGSGNNGKIVSFGRAIGLDTAGMTVGKPVYVDTTAGGITKDKPTGPTHLIQNIGIVSEVDATNGVIKVTGVGRSNDIPVNVDVVGSATIGTNEFTQTSAKLANVDANHVLISTAASATSSVASSTLFSNYYTKSEVYTQAEANSAFLEDSAGAVADSNLASTFLKDQTATIEPTNLNVSPGANKIVAVDNAGTAFEAGVISDLDDVTFSPDPTQGQSLVYDGDGAGGWTASTIPTGGAGFVDGSSVSATFSAIQVDDLIVNRLGEGRPTNFIWASDFYLVGSTANGWGQGGQGTGAGLDGTAAYNGPTDRAIGVIRLKSGVGTNGRYNLTTFNQTMDPSTVGLSLSTRVLVSGLWDNGVNDGDVMFGISDNGNTQSMPSDGIYFRYGNSNSNWVAGVANGGSVTETDTTIAPTPGTFQVLQIMCDENWTTAQFFIDGVKRATLTLGVDNFPTGTNRMGFRYAVINDTTNVTTGNQLIIDWHYFKITCSQSRGENYIRAEMDPIE